MLSNCKKMSKFRISLYICFVLLVTLMVSCGRKTDQYEVSGKLENVNGTHFYVSHEMGDSIVIDTIPINAKGEFSFKGNVDTLTVMSFYFNENTKSTFVLVDKGWTVEVKGDVKFSDIIEVQGGDVNNDLTDFKNKNKSLLKSRMDILNSAEEKINENDSSNVKDYVGDLMNVNFELANVAAAYITAHPDKVASVLLLNVFFKDETSIPRLNENLLILRGKAADFPMTHDLKAYRDKVKMSAVDSKAPYFSLKNLKGKDVRLQDFNGKYILLSFVSTTCGVCREENADQVSVYDQLKKQKQNIEFITIVKDVEQEPVPKSLSDSVKWNMLPVDGGWGAQAFEDYYIRAIPYNILISPTGYIVERDVEILSVPEKLDQLTGGKK